MSRPCVERSGSDRKHGKQAAMVSSGPHKGCLLVLVSHGSSTKDQNTEAARLRSCTYSFILSDGSLLAVRPMLPGAAAAGLRQYLESSLLACREYNAGCKGKEEGGKKRRGRKLESSYTPCYC